MARNLLCSPDTLFRHIGLLLGERLDTLLTSSESKISGFTRPHVIGFVADLFVSTLESGFSFSGFAVEFAGCVWTVAVSGNKKLWTRKYPDTCALFDRVNTTERKQMKTAASIHVLLKQTKMRRSLKNRKHKNWMRVYKVREIGFRTCCKPSTPQKINDHLQYFNCLHY